LSYLAHIQECNAFDSQRFRPFMIDGKQAGWIRPEMALRLSAFRENFSVEDDQVRLSPALATPEARTEAVGNAMQALARQGAIPQLRAEMYPVMTDWGQAELLQVDRAGVHALGVLAVGVHLNGFVGRGDDMKLWIARRARDKAVAPGKLDHLVAGGQPAGLGLTENLVKECAEEADMPPMLARKAHPVGAIRYLFENEQGLRNDLIFCYDLECPPDFTPRPADGEVEAFELWPVAKVQETVLNSRDFKFNVPLVLIDFMIRHGHITPENEPDYLALVRGLRGSYAISSENSNFQAAR
jgi:isopentenyldiphosphate isomerase